MRLLKTIKYWSHQVRLVKFFFPYVSVSPSNKFHLKKKSLLKTSAMSQRLFIVIIIAICVSIILLGPGPDRLHEKSNLPNQTKKKTLTKCHVQCHAYRVITININCIVIIKFKPMAKHKWKKTIFFFIDLIKLPTIKTSTELSPNLHKTKVFKLESILIGWFLWIIMLTQMYVWPLFKIKYNDGDSACDLRISS